jgi:uncharacterized protein
MRAQAITTNNAFAAIASSESDMTIELGRQLPGGGQREELFPPARNDVPLPFIRHDEAHLPPQSESPISYRKVHEQSLITFAGDLEVATIPIERARAEILLVAGGDDALWPSDAFARAIADRLHFWKNATVVGHPEAGHRVLLPGETTPRSTRNAYGGNDAADLALGRWAWRAIVNLLRLA